MSDPVKTPKHYTQGDIECIDAIRSALGSEAFKHYCRGATIKYLWRCPLKHDEAEDLRKAREYLDRAIREVEGG